jgi:trehalose-phosphatase
MESENQSVRAIILDVDGVITDTRRIHFKAWKKTLENYPFEEADYQKYVDGKPREDGLRSFLESRAIILSKGKVDELVVKKDLLFKEFLKSDKPEVFPDALKAINRWRQKKVPLAVISSSKNSKLILKEAGLLDSFDVLIDGEEGQRLNIPGKPDPAYLNEAARRLGFRPEDCLLVEDAISGITAGKNANLMEVIGITRDGQTPAEELYLAGADSVVHSLLEIGKARNAISFWEDIKLQVGKRDIALFIDFDGTLSEIVSDPAEAVIKESLKEILQHCSRAIKIAVISGRDRLDVKEKIGLDSLFYVGSHGLDMCGPGCFYYLVEDARKFAVELQDATMAATSLLQGIKGILIERKSFSTAIHYRMVVGVDDEIIRKKILNLITSFPHLKIKDGKKVIELFPKIKWGKGEAISKLSGILGIDTNETIPFYLGDDLTDEDAFIELRHKGIGIKIDETGTTPTMARYFLKDPDEVEKFLLLIAEAYTGENKRWRAGL